MLVSPHNTSRWTGNTLCRLPSYILCIPILVSQVCPFFLVIWCTTDLLQAHVTSLSICRLFRWFLLDQWLFYLQYSLDSFQSRNLQTNRILVSAENMWSDQRLSNLPGKLKGTSISIIVVILQDCLSIRPCCIQDKG